MRVDKLISELAVIAATSKVLGLDVQRAYCASLHAVWAATGAPNGTIKVQGSTKALITDSETPSLTDADWEDITGLSQAIAGSAGSKLFNVDGIGYRFIRLYWLRTSGSLTVSSYGFSKG